jgi:hypothetical protein
MSKLTTVLSLNSSLPATPVRFNDFFARDHDADSTWDETADAGSPFYEED